MTHGSRLFTSQFGAIIRRPDRRGFLSAWAHVRFSAGFFGDGHMLEGGLKRFYLLLAPKPLYRWCQLYVSLS